MQRDQTYDCIVGVPQAKAWRFECAVNSCVIAVACHELIEVIIYTYGLLAEISTGCRFIDFAIHRGLIEFIVDVCCAYCQVAESALLQNVSETVIHRDIEVS